MEEWSLNRTTQCAKCPWKKAINPHDIPDGYSVELHKSLSDTIANPGELPDGSDLRIMACHESHPSEETHCVGWLNHQLGRGNNIPLRLSMVTCSNTSELTVVGEQHEDFKDTIPKE